MQKLVLLECQCNLLKTFPKVYLLQQLQLLISCIIFKTCFLVVNYWFKVILIRRFQKFNREETPLSLKIFEIERLSWVKVLPSSVSLKLEITVLFGISSDSRDCHNSLSLPIVSESFFLKNDFFCNQFWGIIFSFFL